MADRPMVSVVTATLNQRPFLPQTIESVSVQTYSVLEHIIVDGGSTDGTLDILRSLDQDPRIRWTSRPDAGMYHAINDGLRQARGEIVTYLNSDDLLLPWAIDRVVNELAQHADVDLVYGDALRYFQDLDLFELILQPQFHVSTLGRTGSLIQPAVFWRRRLLETVGPFDTAYRLSADLDFWLRASRLAKFRQIDEVLAIERAHADAQTYRLRSQLGVEARAIRAKVHPDGLLRLPLKVAARLVDGLAARRRMVKFVRAQRSKKAEWSAFRGACGPRIRWPWFVVATITPRPLVGTRSRSIWMALLRRRWLDLDAPRVWSAVAGKDASS